MNTHSSQNYNNPQQAHFYAPSSAPAVAPRPQLAHVVHLSEGTLLLVREGTATHGWRDGFRARLRTCGPWNEMQVQDYFLLTYGTDARRWPISMASIAQIFATDQLDRNIAVARDTPEVRAFLS